MRAIDTYLEGLHTWMKEGNHYGELLVPLGDTYNGMPIKQCGDRWMHWIVGQANGEPDFRKQVSAKLVLEVLVSTNVICAL